MAAILQGMKMTGGLAAKVEDFRGFKYNATTWWHLIKVIIIIIIIIRYSYGTMSLPIQRHCIHQVKSALCIKFYVWVRTSLLPARNAIPGLREIASKTWSSGPRNRSMLTGSNSYLAPRRCFRLWTKFLAGKRILDLPDHDSLSDLLERFNGYFIDKTSTTRQGLEQSEVQMAMPEDAATATESLTAFQRTSQKEVLKATWHLTIKSCPIDPLPTWMLKQHIGTLLPTITEIVDLSMATGMFPSQFKKALVTPSLKKASLDVNVLKNYRPVSNLPYISKVLEKVVVAHLLQHIQENGMQEWMQSQYHAQHSTKTALVRVSNDLLCVINQRKVVILILLDLSVMFDTIDHNILQQHL